MSDDILCPPYNKYNTCWPGVIDSDQTCFRYVDKESTGNEQYLFSNYYREQINQYGTKITYYVNAYNALSADNFYGEDPTRKFAPGIDINVVMELSENANTLTRFGFQADDEITILIHISAFQEKFYNVGMKFLAATQGDDSNILTERKVDCDDERVRTEDPSVFETQFDQVQPKSGDIFTLTEYGKGRPGERSGKMFEVTEILDQDIARFNQLGGHYTWIVKGKRFDYSFEPGLEPERGSQQVYDNSFNGILSGGIQDMSPVKKYDEQNAANNKLLSINDVSKSLIFNMNKYNNTNVYGEY
jgi:hypothetical protein